MSFVLSLFMIFWYRRENQHRDAIMSAMNIGLDDYEHELMTEEREKADDALFFRYTV